MQDLAALDLKWVASACVAHCCGLFLLRLFTVVCTACICYLH